MNNRSILSYLRRSNFILGLEGYRSVASYVCFQYWTASASPHSGQSLHSTATSHAGYGSPYLLSEEVTHVLALRLSSSRKSIVYQDYWLEIGKCAFNRAQHTHHLCIRSNSEGWEVWSLGVCVNHALGLGCLELIQRKERASLWLLERDINIRYNWTSYFSCKRVDDWVNRGRGGLSFINLGSCEERNKVILGGRIKELQLFHCDGDSFSLDLTRTVLLELAD